MDPQANEVQHSTNESVDQSDAIASLLIGEEDKDEAKEESVKPTEKASNDTEETSEDLEGVEELTEKSTDDEEEPKIEAQSDDDDVTWEKVLGVEEGQLNFDEDGNLVGINTKIDGESSTVKIPDLIAGYQLNKAITQKSQALSEERKEFESLREQAVQTFKAKLDDADAMTQYLEKRLVTDFEGVDWEALRVNNPAEYAALRQDYASQAQELMEIKGLITSTKTEEEQKVAQANEAARQSYLKEQYDKMVDNNPTWISKEVFQKDMSGLREFCSDTYGFTEDDFKLVSDARIIELVKDASKYHSGQKLAEQKLKNPVPKFQKSVGTPSKKVSKLQKLTNAAKKAKGEQKRDLQSSAVAELLTGGQ